MLNLLKWPRKRDPITLNRCIDFLLSNSYYNHPYVHKTDFPPTQIHCQNNLLNKSPKFSIPQHTRTVDEQQTILPLYIMLH